MHWESDTLYRVSAPLHLFVLVFFLISSVLRETFNVLLEIGEMRSK